MHGHQHRWPRLSLFLVSITLVVLFHDARAQTDPVQILLQVQTGINACYSLDGTGNNPINPTWGAVNEPLLRVEDDAYINGTWWNPRSGPNPREVSNRLSHETCAEADRTAEPCLNDWYWLWGQMIDHDMTLVPMFDKATPNISMSITAPANDALFPGRHIPFRRSLVRPEDPRQQINLATAFLDASHIYGTDPITARRIRTLSNGMLQASPQGFLPVLSAQLRLNHSSTPTFDELGSPHGRDQFLCADMRCNQHAPMAALQTMVVREHNRIARAIVNARHPAYRTDEQIFQAAKALVIAELQAVTYQEFLPLTLGRFNLPRFLSYNPSLRPSILNSFATAAFRIVHSMIGCNFREMTGNTVLRSVNFASAFFDSTWIRGPPAQPNRANREANAYQTIMHGLGANPSTRMNPRVAPALRSVLFSAQNTPLGPVPEVAFDVIAADIQRGRDHGLLGYNDMRRAMGWTPLVTFSDISLDPERVRILQSLYPTVEDIDLFVGLMTEDALDGALFGPVATSIMRDQFERVRNGDSCWYENRFSGRLLTAIRSTKLRDLVDRNFGPNNPNAPLSSGLGGDGGSASFAETGRDAQTMRVPGTPGPSPASPLAATTLGAQQQPQQQQQQQEHGVSSMALKSSFADTAASHFTTETLRPAGAGEEVVAFGCTRRTGCEGLTLKHASTMTTLRSYETFNAYHDQHRQQQQQQQQQQGLGHTHSTFSGLPQPHRHVNTYGTMMNSHVGHAHQGGRGMTIMSMFGGVPYGYRAVSPMQFNNNLNLNNLFNAVRPNNNNAGFVGAANGAVGAQPVARVLTPAPGVNQVLNRPALPPVPPEVLVSNVFLMPACRR